MGDITVCHDGRRRGDSGGIAKFQLTLVNSVVCITGWTVLQQRGSKKKNHTLCLRLSFTAHSPAPQYKSEVIVPHKQTD